MTSQKDLPGVNIIKMLEFLLELNYDLNDIVINENNKIKQKSLLEEFCSVSRPRPMVIEWLIRHNADLDVESFILMKKETPGTGRDYVNSTLSASKAEEIKSIFQKFP